MKHLFFCLFFVFANLLYSQGALVIQQVSTRAGKGWSIYDLRCPPTFDTTLYFNNVNFANDSIRINRGYFVQNTQFFNWENIEYYYNSVKVLGVPSFNWEKFLTSPCRVDIYFSQYPCSYRYHIGVVANGYGHVTGVNSVKNEVKAWLDEDDKLSFLGSDLEGQLGVYNSLGQLLFTEYLPKNEVYKCSTSMKDMASGLYYWTIKKTNRAFMNGKIIKGFKN
jgi:hypothetical protein